MSAEASAMCVAGYGEGVSMQTDSRNGYRGRHFDTRAGSIELPIPAPSGSYFPVWFVESQRRAERTLVEVWARAAASSRRRCGGHRRQRRRPAGGPRLRRHHQRRRRRVPRRCCAISWPDGSAANTDPFGSTSVSCRAPLSATRSHRVEVPRGRNSRTLPRHYRRPWLKAAVDHQKPWDATAVKAERRCERGPNSRDPPRQPPTAAPGHRPG